MKIKLWMILLIILIFTIVLIPKFYLYEHNVADSFIYSHTSIAQSTINDESIAIRPYQSTANTINRHANGQSTRFVTPLIVGILGLITNQPLSDLQFAPICGIMLIFIGFVLAKKMLDSTVLALVFVLILAFEPTANSLTNSTYIQGWGFVLYFIVVLLALIWYRILMQDISLQKKVKNSILMLILISLLLIISEFTYYTTTYYIIILLCFLGVVGVIKISKLMKNNKNRKILIFTIILSAIILICLFVTYDPAVGFVQSSGNMIQSLFDSIKDVFLRIFGLSDGSGQNGMAVLSGSQLTGNDAFFVGVVWYAIILLPIFILSLLILYRFIRRRTLPSFKDGLFLCIALTGILNTILYSSIGLFDLKFQAIVYPLLTLYALKRLLQTSEFTTPFREFSLSRLKRHLISQKRAFLSIFVIVLLLSISFAKFEVKYPILTDKIESHNKSHNQATEWFVENHSPNQNVTTISDLRMSGRIMLSMVSNNHEYFDSYIYQTWFIVIFSMNNTTQIENVFNTNNLDYVIISEQNREGLFSIGTWRNAIINETEIRNFEHNETYINNIYCNNNIEIYKKI